MKRVTADQVLRLHRRILERFWGDPGLRERSLLESAVARPFASFDGADAHPEIHDKAAALWHALAVNHAFVDANRPVALAATLVFLRVNGYELGFDEERLVELSKRIVSGELTAIGLAAELRDAIHRI